MAIDGFIKENTELLLEIHKELCLIPAPSHHEEKRAEYCKKYLEDIGYRDVYMDDALNVVCPINCQGSDAITALVAHTDTVFPDMESMPYREENGKIFGPGVGDDTASLAILLVMAKYWKETGFMPKNGVLLVCNSCEEGLGNLKGTRRVMSDYRGRIKQFISFDSKIHVISNRCVGSHRYKVKVLTQGGHSYQAFGNKNAIAEAAKIISKIYDITVPAAAKTTYNVGIIQGGTSVNTIAQSCEFLCEYRSEDVSCLALMKQQFEELFKNSNTDEVKVLTERIGERPCAAEGVYDKVEPLERICEGVIEKIVGEKPNFDSTSNDCNIPLSLGIPAICIGVYEGGGTHTREEWIEAKSLPIGLEIAVKVMEELA